MYPYQLIRAKRKTVSLQINDDCEVVVRAPLKMPQKDIDAFVSKNEAWIARHMPAAEKRRERREALTPERIAELTERAKREIPPKVAEYAARMGVQPTGIKITAARKRFGSCSPRNSLCFSCLLMHYPPEAVEYVVVHELAHIRHHNHSAAFYAFVSEFLPDYREREKLLRQN